MNITFRFRIGTPLQGLAVIVIIGTGSPDSESVKFDLEYSNNYEVIET